MTLGKLSRSIREIDPSQVLHHVLKIHLLPWVANFQTFRTDVSKPTRHVVTFSLIELPSMIVDVRSFWILHATEMILLNQVSW